MGRMTPDPQTLADVCTWLRRRGEVASRRGTPFAAHTALLCVDLADALAAEAPWSPSCDGTPAEHGRRG